MTITVLHADGDARLIAAMAEFEPCFSYPLGVGQRFHIAHGGDGWRFFNAQGEAAYVIAERDGQILGTLGAALRRLHGPEGESAVLYLGDLKIRENARCGMTLFRLVLALRAWLDQRVTRAFAVVMDGTDLTPLAYTGRAGIPAFLVLDRLAIVWLRTDRALAHASIIDEHQGQRLFTTLAQGRCHATGGDPALRSAMPPRWIASATGHACGRVEDTLLAKRLQSNDRDMRSAHLSCFAYRQPADGLPVLETAQAMASAAGYPMLFTAVPIAEREQWQTLLGSRVQTIATATVFGANLQPGPWIISTADI